MHRSPSHLHPPLGRVEAEERGFGEGASSVSNRCPPLAALDPPVSGRVKLCRDQCTSGIYEIPCYLTCRKVESWVCVSVSIGFENLDVRFR